MTDLKIDSNHGRRTAIQIPLEVNKDDFGFDSIDEIFALPKGVVEEEEDVVVDPLNEEESSETENDNKEIEESDISLHQSPFRANSLSPSISSVRSSTSSLSSRLSSPPASATIQSQRTPISHSPIRSAFLSPSAASPLPPASESSPVQSQSPNQTSLLSPTAPFSSTQSSSPASFSSPAAASSPLAYSPSPSSIVSTPALPSVTKRLSFAPNTASSAENMTKHSSRNKEKEPESKQQEDTDSFQVEEEHHANDESIFDSGEAGSFEADNSFSNDEIDTVDDVVKRTKGKSRIGRATMGIVEMGERLGIGNDEAEEQSEEEQEDNKRRKRPQRVRMNPLQYWKGESVIYTRRGDPVTAVLPVISAVQKAEPTPQKNSKRKRKQKNDK